MKNIPLILYILLILLVVGGCAAKKNSETYISQQDSISYALPSENLIRLNNLCDTINFGPVLSHSSGPVKVDVKTVGRGSVEILTQYDTIFKDRVKEVEVVKTKEVQRKTIRWDYTLIALILGLGIGLIRPWRFL